MSGGVEALARVLCEAGGVSVEDLLFPLGITRYGEQAERILADPGPLLEALAEAGVLEAQVRDVCSCGSFRGGMWRPHNDTDDGVHDIHRERCYVTEWATDV